MPLPLEEIVADYAAGAASHRDGTKLLASSSAIWARVQSPTSAQVGIVSLRDSARRQWAVDVRRDGRGRYLQFRPIGIDLERFRASADGHLPSEWLPIDDLGGSAFAIFSAAGGGEDGPDGELAFHVRRLLDRMVREAHHGGLVFDEDEDEEPEPSRNV